LNKEEKKVFTRYTVEIGDALWTALYNHVAETYGIESVCEDGEQKFAVLTADDKYYRLDFSINEDNVVEFAADVSELEGYEPAEEPQFDAAAVAEYKAKKDEEQNPPKKDDDNDDGEEEKCPKCGKPKSECDCEDEDDDEEKNKGKKEKYNLEEIQEYVELSEKYSALETNYSNAQQRIEDLESQIASLTEFKNKIDKAEKQKMIDSFYVLSDEDKKDVIDNIDTYSVEDIEAKLSIICVRKKVNFNLDDKDEKKDPTTFSLNGGVDGDESVPAWVKALRSVASEM
jgi:hypothetical protein